MERNELSALLAYSLDNELSAEQQQILDKAFAKYPDLLKEREELLQLRQLLGRQRLSPNKQFVNTVLEGIATEHRPTEKSLSGSLVQLFPKVAAACVIVLLVSLLNLYLNGDGWSTEALLGLSELTPDDAYSILTEE
ncbi:MAG: hypothetical protein AAFO94_05250 [Bacteroidota bacterium]